MAELIPMLALSPTMSDGTIAAWKYKEGEEVRKGSVLCEVETDKAVMDYEVPSAGTLLKIVAPAGASVAVGQPIAIIGKAGEDIAELMSKATITPAQEALPIAGNSDSGSAMPVTEAQSEVVAPHAPAPELPRQQPDARGGEAPYLAPVVPRSSPLARILARDAKVELREVHGTGPGGRVVKRDVEAFMASRSSYGGGRAAPVGVVQGQFAEIPRDESRVVPLSRSRATIARRLSESMREAPHFYLRSAIEADRLLAFRQGVNSGLPADSRVSLNAIFVKLAAKAIVMNPSVNAIWRGDAIEYPGKVDIALAVALPEGLVAPVVRDCATKGLVQIEGEFRSLIADAKAGRLKPEHLENPTFTISNLGAWGVEEFTAIINPPASAILALGAIAKESVVRQDQDGSDAVVVRSMLRATLSCDHRTVDGAVGAAFLRDLKALIEEPARALL